MNTFWKSSACMALLWSGLAVAECDEAQGRKQFNRCAACHATESGIQGAGPSLAGLYGRQAGSLPAFLFSVSMEDAGILWNESSLSRFLENPAATVPGNAMPFGGIRNEAQRNALLCYLATL